ncbi:MAG: beta-galactosidase, partial [Maribacter sp.]|nr:beta-galactosidase [Maribacter sp.]
DKWAKQWQDATYNYRATLVSKPVYKGEGIAYQVRYDTPVNDFEVFVWYSLYPGGQLTVDYNFQPKKENLPNIPRIGMYLTLSNAFKEVTWYGKGPGESYWDRKTGVKTGLYTGKVKDQFHRYPRPQETGNKTDVRWMQIQSNTMTLRASSDQLINASVWPFAMPEIDFTSGEGAKSASGLVPVTKKHGAEIKIGETVQWNIDFQQMGVGGDTSWGRLVHEEYTLPPKTYAYSFTLEPFNLD